jgi:hypothetical protein
MNGFEMRAGHSENVGGAIDQGGGERLAAEAANVDAFLFANVNGVQARRLSANGMNPGGYDFDVFAIAEQTAEEALCHRAAADISRADEEDTFHDFRTGAVPAGQTKTERNQVNARRGRVEVCVAIYQRRKTDLKSPKRFL